MRTARAAAPRALRGLRSRERRRARRKTAVMREGALDGGSEAGEEGVGGGEG